MTTGSVNNPIALLLAEVMRCGLHFAIAGDKIRVGPRDRISSDLLGRIGAHKEELLALWRAVEVKNRPAVCYTDAECAVLDQAGIEPSALPILEAAKSVFPDSTVESAGFDCPAIRRQAANLIWAARRRGHDQGVALRDAWLERVAICTEVGGLRPGEGEALALKEVEHVNEDREIARRSPS